MSPERLVVQETVDPSSWDATASRVGGIIEHSTVYARYVQAAEPNVTPRFFRWLADRDETVGIAVGFAARSPNPLLAPLSSRFFLTTMPALQRARHTELFEFLNGLVTYARSNGNTVLDVHSAASRGGHDELVRLGFKLSRRLEFELDLQRSENELWEAMKCTRRQKVKKANRSAITIREAPGSEGVAHLRRLQADSSRRIIARGGPNITRKHELATDPVNVLLDAGVARIVVAEMEGHIVSAGLFTFFNGQVYHMLSGHSDEGTRAQAPTLLLWEAIKWYQHEGAQRFNLGGCNAEAVREGHPEHGIYEYKRAFGGDMLECTSGTKVLHRTRHWVGRSLKRMLGRT